MKSQLHTHFIYRKMGSRSEPVSYPFSHSRRYLFVKRGFDIIVSLMVILFVLSWLLPLLAVLIKLNSRGPVFFIQKRVGYSGRMFSCLKLRTMVVNEHADTRQAHTDDPRITSIGKFLRLSCIDEFPQFFNVLIGDMSIIGPRPHMLKDCEEFSKYIPQYGSRHAVRPGITGMAQVEGFRGKTSNFFDIVHRYQWDIFYLRNAGLLLDIRIMFRTISQTLLSAATILKTKSRGSVYQSIQADKPC